jgi:nitroreductase
MRAIRQFEKRRVDEDIIKRILEAGRWAGSAKNVQPWHFVVVKDRQTLNCLAQCGKYASHLRQAEIAIIIVTRPIPHAEFDSGRAAQNMMLTAWQYGVGSCIATLHEQEGAKKALRIPEEFEICQAISFGYPRFDVEPAIEGRPLKDVLASIGRKPLTEIVHEEKW